MFIGEHIYIIFLSLFVIKNFRSVFLKVGGITPVGTILRDMGAIKPKGEIRGENAQLLINHLVNFNSLLLWNFSFLQIFIYYDIFWSLLLKQFIR